MIKEDQIFLLRTARETLKAAFTDRKFQPVNSQKSLQIKAATFVTLTKNGQLRGCIGALKIFEPILDNIIRNTLSAAFNDDRFPPLEENELNEVKIEISILSPASIIKYGNADNLLENITDSVDGIIIEYKNQSATFLPQVWEEIKNKADFLSALCQKAGLPEDCWQSAKLKVSKYQVEKFSE